MGRYYSFIPFDHLVETCMKGNFEIYDTSFYFHFHFKPLKNIREKFFTFNFMQFAMPDSVARNSTLFSCFNSFQIQSRKKLSIFLCFF